MVVFLFPFFTEKKEGFNLLQVMNLHLLQLVIISQSRVRQSPFGVH